jgi:spore maturation protein CgeB
MSGVAHDRSAPLAATPRERPRLKIVYVGSHWDYGDPARGVSFEEMTIRRALEGMGHEVSAYDFFERFHAVGRDEMNRELGQFVRGHAPDLAVFFLFGDEIAAETIAGLTRAGIKTFNWFADDHWRFDSFSRRIAPSFSLVSTTDPAAVPKYRALGVPVVLAQWAYNAHLDVDPEPELRYDVTFVGQRYGSRPKVIETLRRAGFEVRCWGFGWDDGRISPEEMLGVFAQSRVNLNFADSWGGNWWRRRRVVPQIKARVFEVPGTGGFLLTQRAPHLDRYFEPDVEIGVFDAERDLVERVRHWLTNEDLRRAAARAGRDRVLAEHTYDHRFDEIFRAAGLTDG